MEVPPPFANLQASRGAERRSTAWQEEPGGGRRSAGALGKFLESESFHLEVSNFNHLWAVDWPARRETSFGPS